LILPPPVFIPGQSPSPGPSDTVAPTVPLNVAISAITTTTAQVTWNQSSDSGTVAVPGAGLGGYTVAVTQSGTPITGSPFTVSPGGTPLAPVFALLDIGGQVSTVSQSGPDVTVTTTAADASYPLTSAIGGYAMQVTPGANNIVASCEIPSTWNSSNQFDNLRVEMRGSLATNAPYFATLMSPWNKASPTVQGEYRSTLGGNATKLTSVVLAAAPVFLFITYTQSTNTFTAWYSTTGNAPISLGSVSISMGTTLTVIFGGNTNAGGPVNGTLQQTNIQTLPTASLSLTGLTSGLTYSVGVQAYDLATPTANVSAASSAVTFATTATATIPNAPRFGFCNTGGNNATYLTSAAVARMARADAVILGLNYEGAGAQCYTGTADSFVKAIQAASTCNTQVVQYFLPDTDGNAVLGAYSTTFQPFAVHFTVKNAAGGSSKNYYNTSWTVQNTTTYPANVTVGTLSGKLEDGSAQFCYQYLYKGTFGGTHQSTDFMSTIAGFWHDNFQLRIPIGGTTAVSSSNPADWNQDGVNDFQSETTPVTGAALDQAYRDGLALWCNWLITNAPTLLRFGNLASWGDANANNGFNFITGTNTTGVTGLINGGFLEGMLGLSWGQETYNSPLAVTMSEFAAANTAGGTGGGTNLGYVGPACYWNNVGKDYYALNNGLPNWQAARHHLCHALQWDSTAWVCAGNSTYTSPDYIVQDVTWLDEFTVNPSTLVCTGESSSTTGKGYLGQALDPAWTQLGNGVYARRYFNSTVNKTFVAFCNIRGNGSQSFNIVTYFPGLRFTHLTGTQDATTNNGATVTAVTMPDRSGLIGVLAP
jgi:hypothetical protein